MLPHYLRYWGKASPSAEQVSGGARYHLLPYHSLDVAAVVWRLLCPQTALCQQLSSVLHVDPVWLQRWFSFCAALHDVGKFSSAFQSIVTGLSDELVSPDGNKSYVGVRHDSLGFLLWDRQLKCHLAEGLWAKQQYWRKPKYAYQAWEPWIKIVTGHHGEPPRENLESIDKYYAEEDVRAVQDYVAVLNDLFQPDLAPLADKALTARLRSASWQLAGLMVLADWSGSDQSLFKYQCTHQSLPEYWENVALKTAYEAVARMKPERVVVRPFSGIEHLFPFISQPTPLQNSAAYLDVPSGPQFWLLEDVTGAGKTEAALTLVSRIMSAGLAEGVYIGLPTMATANSMYERMSRSYRTLFDKDSKPSLVLAHGARDLSRMFSESLRLSEQQTDHSYAADELSGSAYCNSWVADSRKKSLFADVGVGTIDQALLAVLPARHQALRILGLRDKVLLLDEVHAFDPYVKRLLCGLLEAHAAQGGSVVMLSATLPQEMRNDYINAYRRGRGQEHWPLEHHADQYPLITLSADKVSEYSVDSRDSVYRSLSVEVVSEKSAVIQHIRSALGNGTAVCWIRNTVADARAAYQQAVAEGWAEATHVTLFHSRFAMCDRQKIENDVLQRFGKDSLNPQRAGQLLIATQVVEQSLDLDFDLMVTDLAPIDLIIQRAGRLHRHTRDSAGNPAALDTRPAPVLYVYAPQPREDITEQWLLPEWRGTQAVYRHLGQLWLTLKAIERQHWVIQMPEDARVLIEAVYASDAQGNYPQALERASLDSEGQQWAESRQAKTNQLELSMGYCRDSSEGDLWAPDTKTPTRLSAETITVALARREGEKLVPWARAESSAWALSQITLREKEWFAAKAQIPVAVQEEIEQLRGATHALKWVEVLPLIGELAECYSPDGGWRIDG